MMAKHLKIAFWLASLLLIGNVFGADSVPASPWVTATDGSHPAATSVSDNALQMPPGTIGAARPEVKDVDRTATRPPISDAPAPGSLIPVPALPLPTAAPTVQAAAPVAASAQTPASGVAAPASAADQLALRNMVQATRDSMVVPIKPPPSKITVKAGITEIIPISIGRMNRFLTPFREPQIKTATDEKYGEIKAIGSIIYVVTDSSEPISLFVLDKSAPEQAISLTLTPVSIPPVQVELALAGYEPKPTLPAEKAQDKPNETPYVEVVKALMRNMAQHHIPEGFAMWQLKNVATRDLPRCHIQNVDVRIAQAMEGHAMTAFVARAVNATIDPAEIDESACSGPNVLAVAAWPRTHLEPGQDTEIYIIVRRTEPGESPPDRPSVLRSGD